MSPKEIEQYFQTLQAQFNVSLAVIRLIADVLGPAEYQDGLVNILDEFKDLGLL